MLFLPHLTEEQSISLEVDASAESSAQELVEQGESINEWIPDAHIKLPITTAGLEAAEQLVRNGIQVNMTLCFTREQAYAVHLMAESAGATRGQVFVSPFMGRLDDIGEDGLQLIEDISRMLKGLESPVLNLAASVRSVEHIEGARLAGADIITIHPEATDNLVDSIKEIKSHNKKAGVSLNPETPVSKVLPVLNLIDLVLVMSVNPGFGGQKFISKTLEKVKILRKEIDSKKLKVQIEIDGGINFENSKNAINAGVDILVSGTTIFKENGGDLKKNIQLLKTG